MSKKKKKKKKPQIVCTCVQPASRASSRRVSSDNRLNIYASVTVCTPNTLVRTVDCLVNTGVHTELIFLFLHDAKDPLKRFMSCKTKKAEKQATAVTHGRPAEDKEPLTASKLWLKPQISGDAAEYMHPLFFIFAQ